MGFDKNFKWGAATASHQIEGAIAEDGKGLSIWDKWSEVPGNIIDGYNGNIACDHYHRYREDAALMRTLGLQAYRFSIAWPRVIPDGFGAVNEKGLDFYDNLVDALLEANVEPYLTLYHWDMPYEAYIRGGWLNPDSPHWFEKYTRAVVDRLSDRVKYWFTLNEPQCFIGNGLYEGRQAPGLKMDLPQCLLAAHHSLLAHGRAVGAIREHSKQTPFIGAAPTGSVCYPENETDADIQAAYKATFAVNTQTRQFWTISWFTDPIYTGQYPQEALEIYGSAMPKHSEEDMRIISAPLDFFGLNLYNGRQVRAADNAEGWEDIDRHAGFPQTAMGWPVTPEVLYWGPRFCYERYGKPIYITENGIATPDWVDLDGEVKDSGRIDFLHRYLREYRRAADEDIPVHGYFLWTFMDNFEWKLGYTVRLGIVYTDYETLERIPKASAYWYRKVIETNGECL